MHVLSKQQQEGYLKHKFFQFVQMKKKLEY